MFRACCVEQINHSKISVKEHGMSAVILNENKEDFLRVKIDGCELKQQTSADFLIEKISSDRAVIIELKGKGIDKAVKQLEATIDWLKSKKYTKKLANLVVCSNVPPRAKTNKAIAQEKFRKCDMRLNFVEGNREYIFENIFTSTPLAKKQ